MASRPTKLRQRSAFASRRYNAGTAVLSFVAIAGKWRPEIHVLLFLRFFCFAPLRSVCREYKLNCWDIGGQRSLRSYWRNYFEQTDGLLWVVDSADRERIDVCREELQRLLLEEKLAGATLLVLANKQDLTGRLAPEELQAALAIDTISAARHCRVQACSAYTGEGLEAGIEWLVADIAERIFTLD